MRISKEEFDQQRRPRFGTTNPERMQLAFWEWMLRGDESQAADEDSIPGEVRSGYGPWHARKLFQVPLSCEGGPIWTFDRMGATRTELPDGRIICVGGEHEDDNDPDFCIYNDVVVVGPAGRMEIYGYPKEVFPPTDFHTASLVGDRIIVVGCLGYPADRRSGHTPVYALDPSDYRISEVMPTGEPPGWIFKHEAEVGPDGVITIRGGEVIEEREDGWRYRRNFNDHALDTRTSVWRRLTSRRWRQLSIHREEWASFPLEIGEIRLEPENVFPSSLPGAEMVRVSAENPREGWFRMKGCPVSVTIGWRDIEVIFHGNLSAETATLFADAVRAKTEAVIGHRCVLEHVYETG